MKNKIAMIGSGAMGTAIAKVMYDAGNEDITIYGVMETEVNELAKGFNTKYFPNSIDLPKFKTTMDMKEAVDGATHIVFAVPSKAMSGAVEAVLSNINSDVKLISVSKGFYPGTDKSLHEGIKEATKHDKRVLGVVSLIGPSHAEEIVMSMPTVVAIVDKDKKLCAEMESLFNTDYFRTYIQTDVRGAEVGAAYKNVLAIASGIASGLGYGINATAALLTRGLAEMRRFNKAMKGKEETIMGLTGIGDLIVTATSDLSRNFTFGKNLVKNKQEALKTTNTVEGLVALDSIHKIGQSKKLELPIVEFLYKAIHENIDVNKIIEKLWARDLKAE